MRELLEVERLARLLLATSSVYAECDGVCRNEFDCNNEISGIEVCPKCATQVPFKVRCDGEHECDTECGAHVSVDLEDACDFFRDLRLALVALDLARSRGSFGEEAVSGTVAVAKTEAA
jgi:hypothetical protein